MEIRVDDLSGAEIIRLLDEHLRSVAQYSPPESVHALDLDGLRKPDVTFWTVWQDSDLMGCGALKELDPRHGEIKSMRTASMHLRKGVAASLLHHILEEAKRRSYERLSLETGSMDAFAPARSLYARFDFKPCGPFASYVEDPYSVFMTRDLREEWVAPDHSGSAREIRMLIKGKCHCGNIAFEWEGDLTEIPARACGCSFCVKHGGVWTSNPDSSLAVAIRDISLVSKYTFGTRTATFHVCSRCGAVPLVTSEIASHLYAVVNVNLFENVDQSLLHRTAASFEGEDTESRLARRARNWIADVRITHGDV